jgi:hypothetical protein
MKWLNPCRKQVFVHIMKSLPMNESLLHYLIEVASGITVAVLVGVVGFYRGSKTERHRVSKAQFVFVNRLDELIKRAVREGPRSAVLNARAIVAARNSLASSLVSISSQLNSEIDRLAEDIGELHFIPATRSETPTSIRPPPIQEEEAYATIQVLARIWPAKRSQIVFEVRKLLAELGIPFDPIDESHFENPSNDRTTT